MKYRMRGGDEVSVPVVDERPIRNTNIIITKQKVRTQNSPKPVVSPVVFAFGVVAVARAVAHLV